MVYTEIKERNGNKYFYRASSVREGSKIKKRRIYLGVNLPSKDLYAKELEADRMIIKESADKTIEPFKSKIIPILKKYNVKKAGIFGSYARGENRKNSDIDIVIQPPKGMGLGFVRIALDLEDSLGKKVDLLTYKSIHSLIRKKILNEERRILNG